MTSTPDLERQLTAPPFVPAGRLRRVGAFATDLMIMAAVGYAFGASFFRLVARWGPHGRLFGLVLMVTYLGAGASVVMGGRTLGKRLWRLEVRRIGGARLPLLPALGRASMVALPYLGNGWGPKEILASPMLSGGLAFVVLVLGGAMLYLLLFNRTGQLLHDLVFRTVVVHAGAPSPTSPLGFAVIHRAVMLAICGLTIVAIIVGHLLRGKSEEKWARELSLWNALNADPRFFSVSVNHTTFFTSSGPATTVSIDGWLKDMDADREMLRRELAMKASEHYKSAPPDNLSVGLTRSYDLGVAAWTMTDTDTRSIDEWRQRLAGPGSPPRPAKQERSR